MSSYSTPIAEIDFFSNNALFSSGLYTEDIGDGEVIED